MFYFRIIFYYVIIGIPEIAVINSGVLKNTCRKKRSFHVMPLNEKQGAGNYSLTRLSGFLK